MTTETPIRHLTMAELEAGLDYIRQSPQTAGKLEGIVIRPATNEREEMQTAEVSPAGGVHGDRWAKTSKGEDVQVTLMNSRAAQLIAQSPERWPLAGDQLYVDLDLSEDNLPPGTMIAVGPAVLEVSAKDHTGCAKFSSRFGSDALQFVNSREGARLNLRGINATVRVAGMVKVGDPVRRLT